MRQAYDANFEEIIHLTRHQLPGKSEDEIKSALMAMVSNKNKPAATAVEMDDDDDRFFG